METQKTENPRLTPQNLERENVTETKKENKEIETPSKMQNLKTGIETMIHTIMSATITSNRVSRSIPFGNKDANIESMHWFLVVSSYNTFATKDSPRVCVWSGNRIRRRRKPTE